MLDKWIKIGKRRRKLISSIIALDSSRSLEQLSKWSKHNLERELFLLEHVSRKTAAISSAEGVALKSAQRTAIDTRIDVLIKKAKKDGIWVDNPTKGKWL